MILGISCSPRKDSITADAVKEVLANIEGETKYVSLAGKHIGGCISCLACAKDNKCKVKDDFLEIAELMLEADAIIWGVPNYYNVPNALSHCMLERCFCFRHQEAFLLKDKPVVIISTGYSDDEENSPVLNIVENFAQKNNMNVVSRFLVSGFSQCYTCGYGESCKAGYVVNKFGVMDKITEDVLPLKFTEQEQSISKCKNAAKILNNIFK